MVPPQKPREASKSQTGCDVETSGSAASLLTPRSCVVDDLRRSKTTPRNTRAR